MKIVYSSPQGTGELETAKPEVLIGRDPKSNDIDINLLSDARISKQHARIYFENGAVSIEDLGSTWGTYINGVKLAPNKKIGRAHV